jgi:hypothetical protein
VASTLTTRPPRATPVSKRLNKRQQKCFSYTAEYSSHGISQSVGQHSTSKINFSVSKASILLPSKEERDAAGGSPRRSAHMRQCYFTGRAANCREESDQMKPVARPELVALHRVEGPKYVHSVVTPRVRTQNSTRTNGENIHIYASSWIRPAISVRGIRDHVGAVISQMRVDDILQCTINSAQKRKFCSLCLHIVIVSCMPECFNILTYLLVCPQRVQR